MPVELGVWRIDGGLKKVAPERLDDEKRLEDMISDDPAIVDPDLLIIGRQVATDSGKRIDILGVSPQGELVVVELKRHRTPRDVVAQALDYGSWVRDLTYEQVANIYADYAATSGATPRFETAFGDRFGSSPQDTLNESHRLIIVASELDPSTERIITYLSEEFGVPVNAVFFQHFRDGEHEYLTRTWLRDPREAEADTSRDKKREVWNGQDFYVCFGDDQGRKWEDSVAYGFVSAGGGRWYTKTLEALFPGARIFAYIPNVGYYGVGTVTATSRRVSEVTVEVNGQQVPLLDAPLEATAMGEDAEDSEKSEYVVRVDWIKTLPREDAIWEKGMFSNQNSVCKLRNKFTIDRLTERFGLTDD